MSSESSLRRSRFSLGEALADAAATGLASQALVAAKALITDPSGFGSYELMQHLPTILAYSLRHEDDEVRSSAASLLDALGREGRLALADQVAAAQTDR